MPLDPEAQQELETMGLGLIQGPKLPKKLCEICHNDLGRVVTYLNRVKSANDFWHKFGLNLGLITPLVKKRNDADGLSNGTSETRTWKCKECDFTTTGKDPLFKHVWKFHAVNTVDPNTCGICSKTLSSEFYNRQHYFSHHYEGNKEEQLVCSDCGYLAKTSRHLTWHLKYSHDVIADDRIQCEWCVMSFKGQDKLDFHMEHKHPDQFQFVQPKTDENHQIIEEVVPVAKYEVTVLHEESTGGVFDEDSGQMDVDDRDSPWQDEDDVPLKVKKEPGSKVKKEPEPSTSLITEYKPNRKKPAKKPYKQRPTKQDDVTQKCPDCDVEITGKLTMAVGGLRRHYWVRHGRLPETPNVCRSCNKSYNTEHSCRLHYFGKHFDVNFFCDICGKSGMTKAQLGIHKNHVHTKRANKEFMVCRFCKRKYDSIEKMQEHEELHKNDGIERPFVCNECGKCYTTTVALANHVKHHLGMYSFLTFFRVAL